MEILAKILLAAVIGTSMMTLFSYYASNKWNSPFREPILLNKLIFRTSSYKSETFPVLPGWILHYTVGLAFAVIFHFIWTFTPVTPSILTGAILGLAAGFIGIFGWHLMLSLHPDPPFKNSRKFYPHLLVAHIIYGMGAVSGYELVTTS